MQIVMESIAEVYCAHCHLATPTWREKCIHCANPLSGNRNLRVIARDSNSDGSSRGYISRVPFDAYDNSVSNSDAA